MKNRIDNKLLLTVFCIGAVIMMLELIASRIMAPYFGTSFIVWTNILAVVLGSLSVGYWLGGKKSMYDPSFIYLSLLIFLSGIFIFFIALGKEIILYISSSLVSDISLGSLFGTLILLAPLNIVLGMITPYSAGLSKQHNSQMGVFIGALYAVGTLGSIVGVYVLGYIFLPLVGHTVILYGMSLLLFFLSLFIYRNTWVFIRLFIIAGALVFCIVHSASKQKKTVLIDLDTMYNRTLVATYFRPLKEKLTHVRYLITDVFVEQSGLDLGSQKPIKWEYFDTFRLSRVLQPGLSRALMVGGAANAFSYYFTDDFPKAQLDVVEIDPRMTDIAHKYFNLKESKNMTIFHEDGRIFINRRQNKYDAIFTDAFNGFIPVAYLNTTEAYSSLSQALKPGGILYINIISALEGRSSYLFQTCYHTLKQVFPSVYVYGTRQENPEALQNIVFVAMKQHEKASTMKGSWQKIPAKKTILTDDFMPVDVIAPRLISFKGTAIDKYRRLLLPSFFDKWHLLQ
ncbi:MAG: fused MFS/spermidine synthase [Patescibacteria group bacterium]